MRSGKAAVFILLFLAITPWTPGQSFFATEFELDSFQQSYQFVDVVNLDVSELLKEVGRCHPGLSEDDTSLLIQRNVYYIIFHKLNRDRLYIAPDGQYIVDKAAEIYEMLNRIEGIINEGRIRSSLDLREPENLKILDELRSSAKNLRRKFRQYFVELNETDYEFQVEWTKDRKHLMSDYLDKCGIVNAQLKLSLDRFFFNSTPGVVTVEDYNSFSVALLSHSLEVLSDTFSKRLRHR